MRDVFKSIGSKFLTGYGIAVLTVLAIFVSVFMTNVLSRTNLWDLLASATSSFTNGATTTLFFSPQGNETIPPGGTTSIDINVNTNVPINAMGVTISYSSSTLEIVGISKQKSVFDLWTEDTSISEDDGLIHFSGGTTLPGGLIGTGTLLTITVRAKTPGKTKLDFTNVQAYPSDGTGRAIITIVHSITYTILAMTPIGIISGDGASINPGAILSSDLNGDGKVDLVDLSILIVKMMGPYDPRYDLNSDGNLNLGDMATLLSKLGSH
jgi:hypothetical protein